MARYALINGGGKIINVCEWDGSPKWQPDPGITAVLDTVGVDTTWTYVQGQFIAPILPPAPPPAPQPLTADQLATLLIAKAGAPLTAQDVATAKAAVAPKSP